MDVLFAGTQSHRCGGPDRGHREEGGGRGFLRSWHGGIMVLWPKLPPPARQCQRGSCFHSSGFPLRSEASHAAALMLVTTWSWRGMRGLLPSTCFCAVLSVELVAAFHRAVVDKAICRLKLARHVIRILQSVDRQLPLWRDSHSLPAFKSLRWGVPGDLSRLKMADVFAIILR